MGDNHQHTYDAGWSWLVAFASMVLMLLTTGVYCNIGVIMVEVKDVFGATTVETSYILTVAGVSACITSLLINTVVGDILYERALVTFSGILLGSGLICCYFATRLEHIVFLLGISSGAASTIGFGCGLTVLVAHFKKRLALANFIAASGVSLAFFVFPPLLNYLIEEYSLRGTLLIMGGLVLNIFVCAAVMRPSISRRSPLGQNKSTATENEIVKTKQSETASSALLSTHDGAGNINVDNRSLLDNEGISNVNRCDPVTETTQHQFRFRTINNSHAKGEAEAKDERVYHKGRLSPCGHVLVMIERFSVRKDKMHTNVSLVERFGLTLWKIPSFVVFEVFILLGVVASDTVIQFTPLKGQDLGFTEYDAFIIMTVLGGGDFLGRLALGLFGDHRVIAPYRIVAVLVSQLIMGVTANLSVLATSVSSQAIVSGILGVQEGLFYSTLVILLLDLFDSKLLTRMVGISLFVQGFAKTCGAPFMGWLRDTTGSYTIPFHVLGACSLTAGLMLLLLRVTKR